MNEARRNSNVCQANQFHSLDIPLLVNKLLGSLSNGMAIFRFISYMVERIGRRKLSTGSMMRSMFIVILKRTTLK
ncbi:hypothetical protein [Caulobacter phage Cr30]|uniref:hypothetical protein n=1 Tax=Caulobacter phage Cr30 TaxID=1357714 RepID=UPI0004A9B812|nr:hypothetical protein OZ74_gp154 [Caulobacter phage Cr30]AGS81039.1 hypothetical protein [Caulobacter phage Cr30]